MSNTVRLYSQEELNRFAKGEKSLLSTMFLNKGGWYNDEFQVKRMMKGVKKYVIQFNRDDCEDDDCEDAVIYAQSHKLAIEFAKLEYKPDAIQGIYQVITRYVIVYGEG